MLGPAEKSDRGASAELLRSMTAIAQRALAEDEMPCGAWPGRDTDG
jgi:hypothetical protein